MLIPATFSAGTWSLAFPSSNFPAGGAYTLRVVAQDLSGNTSAGTSRTFNVDYDPATAIFVDGTSGSDSNNGSCPTTTTSGCSGGPKLTIGSAITAATATLTRSSCGPGRTRVR